MENEETGWLIESDTNPIWWTGDGWSVDSLNAVRFCREEDAWKVISALGIGCAKATSHMWRDPE